MILNYIVTVNLELVIPSIDMVKELNFGSDLATYDARPIQGDTFWAVQGTYHFILFNVKPGMGVISSRYSKLEDILSLQTFIMSIED